LPEVFSPVLHEPQDPHEPTPEALCRLERNVFKLRRTRYDVAANSVSITTISCQSELGIREE